MCKVLDAREKRGLQQGIQQGEKRLRDLMRILADNGYSMEEIFAMTSEEKNTEELYKKYGILQAHVKEYGKIGAVSLYLTSPQFVIVLL